MIMQNVMDKILLPLKYLKIQNKIDKSLNKCSAHHHMWYIYINDALTLSSMTHSNYWFLAGLLSLHHEHSTLREEIVEGA